MFVINVLLFCSSWKLKHPRDKFHASNLPLYLVIQVCQNGQVLFLQFDLLCHFLVQSAHLCHFLPLSARTDIRKTIQM